MQYHQNESQHKELAACTDEQLCAMAATGQREAEELLVTRYYGVVRACARPLFLAGAMGKTSSRRECLALFRRYGSMTQTRRRRFTPMQRSAFAAACFPRSVPRPAASIIR